MCLQERCYENGECIIGCVPGYVGAYCAEACPSRCLNKVCHLDRNDGTITCTDGCIPGFCHTTCSVPCPGGCVSCDRTCGSCNVTICPERHYGVDCSEICSLRYGKCKKETGQCIRCRRGYYGDECRQECTACFTRAETIIDECLSGCDICQTQEMCPTGFYGDSCEHLCPPGCENPWQGCNRETGECSAGCAPGYHGLTCNHKCSEHCLAGRCDRVTGECSTGCVSGYHGLTCNHKCSEHCLAGRCDRVTGECSTGCVTGYYGLTCNTTCDRFCVGRICTQHDGVCTFGCLSGYKSNVDMCEKYTNEGPDTGIVIALILTQVCLFAGIAAFVFWRCRMRRSRATIIEHVEHDTLRTAQTTTLLEYNRDTNSIQLIAGPSIQEVGGSFQTSTL